MLRFAVLIATFLFTCPACVPLAPGGTAELQASGLEGAYSRKAFIANHGHDTMIGQVLDLHRDGQIAFIVEVGQTWHTGRGRLRFDSAWQEGQDLPFQPATRREPFCTYAGHCLGARSGVFSVSQAEFGVARRDGLDATLIGPDGSVAIHVPADLFTEAQDRARAIGLV